MVNQHINDLIETGDIDSILLAYHLIESQNFDYSDYPLIAGARSLASQIGGDWIDYAKKEIDIFKIENPCALDLRAYKDKLEKLVGAGIEVFSLNLDGCENLKFLRFADCGLKTISLSNCNSLKILILNCNFLTSINLEDLENLQMAQFDDNLLTFIDLKSCQNLHTLDVYDNPLKDIDLKNCNNLIQVCLRKTKLSHLDLSECKKLEYLSLGKTPCRKVILNKELEDFTIRMNSNCELIYK